MIRIAPQNLNRFKHLGFSWLFERYPDFSIIDFQTSHPVSGEFTEASSIEIHVPSSFPLKVPLVYEVGDRSASTFHHVGQQELCPGAELRLLVLTRQQPTLLRFIDHCILRYLIGYRVFRRTGSIPLSKLEHGVLGILDDYRTILGFKGNLHLYWSLGYVAIRETHRK